MIYQLRDGTRRIFFAENGTVLVSAAITVAIALLLAGCGEDPPVIHKQESGLHQSWSKVISGARTIDKWDFDEDGDDEIVVGVAFVEIERIQT